MLVQAPRVTVITVSIRPPSDGVPSTDGRRIVFLTPWDEHAHPVVSFAVAFAATERSPGTK